MSAAIRENFKALAQYLADEKRRQFPTPEQLASARHHLRQRLGLPEPDERGSDDEAWRRAGRTDDDWPSGFEAGKGSE